ncbi:hypothetical protein OY671_009690, partial [Metschnikowia pulcherrima]
MSRSSGQVEVDDISAERGQVDVACDFCGKPYVFDAVDCAASFTASQPANDDAPPTAVMPAPDWPAMTAFFVASRFSATRPSQRGAAALEFTSAAVSVSSSASGTVEAVRWQSTRQIVHSASLQAARAGATAHADPVRIRATFQQASSPSHAGGGGQAGARRRQANAQARIAAR